MSNETLVSSAQAARASMVIGQGPWDAARGRVAVRSFSNARSGFASLLSSVLGGSRKRVLLPAYVGWSSREGSGVFDPIRKTGVSYGFYRVNRDLRIDAADLLRKAAADDVEMVLLVHWFGFVDPQSAMIAAELRRMSKYVVEDCAHALLTDRVGGICGSLGDASLYSLHKILPVVRGGLLILNDPALGQSIKDGSDSHIHLLAEYNLRAISARRRENADLLASLLAPYGEFFRPLWSWPLAGVVPQTWPVLVHGGNRDDFYFGMNEAGFGLTSLYHAQIDEISDKEFPEARWVASRICNLPLHQDASCDDIVRMADRLRSIAKL